MSAPLGRRRFLGLSAGLLGAVLVGCAGDDEPGSRASAPANSDHIRVRTLVRAVRPAAKPSRLVLGVPESEVAMDGLDTNARSMIYQRLVGFDPRTASVYGDLATEFEMLEPLLLRVRLRDDTFFHPNAAGEAFPVTAEAVATDFARRIDEGVFLFSDVIEQIEAPGDFDLLIRLRAPFSLLFEHLARVDASIRASGNYDGLQARLGSGAFVPLPRNGDALLLRPSPLHNGDEQPLLDEIAIRLAERSADLDALFVQGQLDVRVHPDASSRQVAHARRDRLELARPRQALRGLALSLLGPGGEAAEGATAAFRDQRVRRALALAMNRTALSFVDGSMLSGPVGPAFEGDALPQVELQAHPLYQRDVDEAQALLSAAGREGLTVRLSHPDSPAMLQTAQRLVEQFAHAGMRVQLVPRSQAEFQSAFLVGEFEAALFEWDGLVSPDVGLRLHTAGGLDGQRSPWGYSNPVYDAKVLEALTQIDPAERVRHAREAQRMLLDDVPAMLPLSAPLEYASTSAGVFGYEFGAYGFNTTMLSRFWQGTDLSGPVDDA